MRGRLASDSVDSENSISFSLPLPSSRSRLPRNCGSIFRREFLSARRAALPTERLGSFVFARIAGIFLDLAGQNLRDPNRVGYGVGGALLALRSLWHAGSVSCFTLSILTLYYLFPPPRSRKMFDSAAKKKNETRNLTLS